MLIFLLWHTETSDRHHISFLIKKRMAETNHHLIYRINYEKISIKIT